MRPAPRASPPNRAQTRHRRPRRRHHRRPRTPPRSGLRLRGGVTIETHKSDGQTVAQERPSPPSPPHPRRPHPRRTALTSSAASPASQTTTAQFVGALRAAGPTKARIYDTRKTTPGLRALEKYAVRCGALLPPHRPLRRVLIKTTISPPCQPATSPPPSPPPPAPPAPRAPTSPSSKSKSNPSPTQAGPAIPPGLIDIILLDNMSPKTCKPPPSSATGPAPASSSKPPRHHPRHSPLHRRHRCRPHQRRRPHHSALSLDVALHLQPAQQ